MYAICRKAIVLLQWRHTVFWWDNAIDRLVDLPFTFYVRFLTSLYRKEDSKDRLLLAIGDVTSYGK